MGIWTSKDGIVVGEIISLVGLLVVGEKVGGDICGLKVGLLMIDGICDIKLLLGLNDGKFRSFN